MDILIGKSATDNSPVTFALAMGTRHGLIAGATGTGKTVTLQALAEKFSRAGASVFAADVKGDLSGITRPAKPNDKVTARLKQLQITDFQPKGCPSVFWDLYGTAGIPVRTTLSEVGPLLLARILQLNETQEQVLQMAYKIADDQGLLLLDLKDLREFLGWVGDNAAELKGNYGNLAPATIGSIQRSAISLSDRGGDKFFGEPALSLDHILQKDFNGNGVVSVLDATKLLEDPALYSTFLLWLLSELFEHLPEVGDVEVPKLVFFFDEAHLLFRDASNSLLTRIEQVVRLIRSKGVGVYFVTQSPADIPDTVLAQLGNRIQHALRAYTPKDQKAVKTAAESFRPNPKFDTSEVISQLVVGEALVSVLDSEGRPQMVQRTLIAPPESQIGAITPQERQDLIGRSPLNAIYDKTIDRESAYEVLQKRKGAAQTTVVTKTVVSAQQTVSTPAPGQPQGEGLMQEAMHYASVAMSTSTGTGRGRQTVADAMVKSFARNISGQLGRAVVRGILGSISK